MKPHRTSLASLSLLLVLGHPTALRSDTAKPAGKRVYLSASGDFRLTVDPRQSPMDESMEPLLTMTTNADEVLWKRTAEDFQDFQFPMHASISDDGRYLVFGGQSAHNLSWDKQYREGLRFYDENGQLIRFISRRDLPLGTYSISTAHWFDAERTRIEGHKLIFHTPGREEAMEFELATGTVLRGALTPGQGSDENWRKWILRRMKASNAESPAASEAGAPPQR